MVVKQFQFSRLDYQTAAVNSVMDVLADVTFYPAQRPEMNSFFKPSEAKGIIERNIVAIRQRNHVKQGAVEVNISATPALNLDVLMETGTGKTFTMIETMYKLFSTQKLSKFIVLVPSNAIRQGTLKSLEITKDFFASEYNNIKLSAMNYSPSTVSSFIHSSNQQISVLVATYQSFNKDKNTINKLGIEKRLFNKAMSYMQAIAQIRPVIIIDEPHRFEGVKTQEYLAKFNPLMTVRFGATFKDQDYRNLVYTLDSLAAFRQQLVKGITVDTVGLSQAHTQSLCYMSYSGGAKDRIALLSYTGLDGKSRNVTLKEKDNLGAKTGIDFLDGYVVDTVAVKELLFTNGFSIALGEDASYGMMADEVQRTMVQRAVENHFEREEVLFKLGVKALSLFFIDSVGKYMPISGVVTAANGSSALQTKPALVRQWFETSYMQQLALVLAKPDLDPKYRAYLERSAADISKVHKGYFARSHSEKGEEEAIKLILQDKERLLSFETDLRFIFSMWALQEGWDNPNVFTLCKLAPSHSKISKLQQIGRGLRLAVNQNLERITKDDANFELINELTVVVPASEGDFVQAIQDDIAQHSVDGIAKVFDDAVLAKFEVALSTRVANRVLDALFNIGVITLDDLTGKATIVIDRFAYDQKRDAILAAVVAVQGANGVNMQRYFDAYFEGSSRIKPKQDPKSQELTVNPKQYEKFKDLWQNLNRNAVMRYEIDTPVLIEKVLAKLAQPDGFKVSGMTIDITRSTGVAMIHGVETTHTPYVVPTHSVFTIGEFVHQLANACQLSIKTIATVLQRMPAQQFAQIPLNENRAFNLLKDTFIWSIYELIINTVSYEIREIRVKTSLTDTTGELLKTLNPYSFGKELYLIKNQAVKVRSLFNESYMPIDSASESEAVDESSIDSITVFAKLPKLNIPTPVGNYNPDFAYVIMQGDAPAMYMVVESKGYESVEDLGKKENMKISSARQFFKALKAQGLPVHYETKLNGERLMTLVQKIQQQ